MFRWSAIFMIVAILAITGFQLYWLKNNYDREKQNLDITTNSSFRQTILQLQASKLKLEQFNINLEPPVLPVDSVFGKGKVRIRPARVKGKEPVITMINMLQEKIRDSLVKSDTINDISVSAIKNKNLKEYLVDSMPGTARRRIRSFNMSHTLDSTIDPESIRKVSVLKNENEPTIITVDYENKQVTSRPLENKIAIPEKGIFIESHGRESTGKDMLIARDEPGGSKNNTVFRFLYNMDSLSAKDSVTTKEITNAYAARLKEDNIDVQFSVRRLDSTAANLPNTVEIGFSKPAYFGLSLQNIFGYMFGKLKLPILFSLLLLGITIASFVLLYRNMIRQQRLAELKNDFISNISHELKTPIATASVAIEALKSFNAIDDPQKTKEYLSISQNELQRLDLLVDKILKLSIFEKKKIELRKEIFDLKTLAEEIITTLKVQFEKYQANVILLTDGADFKLEADKLHFTSVLYNLLDNALKYGGESPQVQVSLKVDNEHIVLKVKDNGIGIPQEYKTKVFDKFFRVPMGDRHNIKGYGLGLSYVAEVVKQHRGSIRVETEPGKGSEFIIELPIKTASA